MVTEKIRKLIHIIVKPIGPLIHLETKKSNKNSALIPTRTKQSKLLLENRNKTTPRCIIGSVANIIRPFFASISISRFYTISSRTHLSRLQLVYSKSIISAMPSFINNELLLFVTNIRGENVRLQHGGFHEDTAASFFAFCIIT